MPNKGTVVERGTLPTGERYWVWESPPEWGINKRYVQVESTKRKRGWVKRSWRWLKRTLKEDSDQS